MADLSLQEMLQKLPPELQAEVRDFVEFFWSETQAVSIFL